MRIDLYGPAEAAAATGTAVVEAAPVGKPAATPSEDTATLSSGSLSVPSLATQVLQTAEARLAKVNALHQAVSSGAYTLDPSLIAEAIIGESV